MFKIVNNFCTEILQDLFCRTTSQRTRPNATFHRPNINNVNAGEQSIRSFGPIVWDTMFPEDMKKIDNLQDFKKAIGRWVPENCPCKLWKDYIPN